MREKNKCTFSFGACVCVNPDSPSPSERSPSCLSSVTEAALALKKTASMFSL